MKHLFASLVTSILLSVPFHSKAQTQIKFYTTMGDFVVEMTDSLTPITSGNFINLTLQEYYDGVIFHRVMDDFVVQGGDPTGTGYGGPGYTIPDEFDSTLSNIQGTISMANAGPNTGGSQFFFNLVDNTFLDFDKAPLSSAHPVFGWVVSGWQVVEDIGEVPVDGNNKPLTDVVMDSLRIVYWNPMSIADRHHNLHSMDIFPNPVSRESRISVLTKKTGNATFSIFDNMGSLIARKEFSLTAGQNMLPLSKLTGTDLASGLYILKLQQGQELLRKKIIR